MAKDTDSKPSAYPSLYRKLILSFSILTLALVSVFWVVIYKAEEQMEIISLHHWLDTEAKRYQRDYALYGEQTTLPNTAEFTSYWSEQPLPTWLSSYQTPGYYKHFINKDDRYFVVTPHPSGTGFFYIVFNDHADDYLDDYEDSLHLYTLLLGGAATLLALVYGLYFVRLFAKPLTDIEAKIEQISPQQPNVKVSAQYKELRRIEETLQQSTLRTEAYLQREQEFHQFASHELRTPLMVISGSTELLGKVKALPPIAQKAVKRLEQASHDMQIITDALLLLGLEQIEPHHYSSQSLSLLVKEQLNMLSPLFEQQHLVPQVEIHSDTHIMAPKSFVAIVIANLIKNAINHGAGDITIILQNDRLTVSNRYQHSQFNNASYGYGLTIVRRICQRIGWQHQHNQSDDRYQTSILFTSPLIQQT